MNVCHFGDCLTVMPEMAANSVDAVITDPPYGLGFMGHDWDHGVPGAHFWAEALRVAKPGAYLLAFGGTRTYHRLTCAIEDAGWEIRDCLMWVYGSGFPKSKNIEGGRGTALKPAWEPIIMARKALGGTVEQNAAKYGTGVLNIDECRVVTTKNVPASESGNRAMPGCGMGGANMGGTGGDPNVGRWPANLLHDGSDEVLAAFPQAPGQIADASTDNNARKTQNTYGAMKRGTEASADSENGGAVGFKMRPGARRLDEGSAARFFYCAKASKKDREEGCEALAEKAGGMLSNTSGQHITRRDGGAPGPRKNNHPTVKPTELMRYLCRLVTPPGGLILDPFMGSGSTGKAARLEDFQFTGIELNPEYIEIARARISAGQTWMVFV